MCETEDADDCQKVIYHPMGMASQTQIWDGGLACIQSSVEGRTGFIPASWVCNRQIRDRGDDWGPFNSHGHVHGGNDLKTYNPRLKSIENMYPFIKLERLTSQVEESTHICSTCSATQMQHVTQILSSSSIRE